MKRMLCLLLVLVLTLGSASALADGWKDFQYAREVWAFTEDGLARYQAQNGMYGFVNTSGKLVIPASYEEARDFSGGMAAVRRGRLWSFIDTTGKVVIDYVWEDAASFSDDLAAVKRDGRWGYIDKTGTEIISCQYAGAGDFHDGAAKVVNERGRRYFIDKAGEEVDAPAWASESIFTIGVVSSADGRVYTLSCNGRVIAQTTVYENGAAGFTYDDIQNVSGYSTLWVIRQASQTDADAEPRHTYALYNAAIDRIVMQGMKYISPVCSFHKIAVSTDEFAYYVNTSGEMVGDQHFAETYDFGLGYKDGVGYGYARVRQKDGRYTYVKSTGRSTFSNYDSNWKTFQGATDMVNGYVLIDNYLGWKVTDSSFR